MTLFSFLDQFISDFRAGWHVSDKQQDDEQEYTVITDDDYLDDDQPPIECNKMFG